MNKGPAAKEFACPGQNDKDITVNFTFVFQTSDTIVVEDEAQIFLFIFLRGSLQLHVNVEL